MTQTLTRQVGGTEFDIILETQDGRDGRVLGLHCTIRVRGVIHAVGKSPVPGRGRDDVARRALIALAERRAESVVAAGCPPHPPIDTRLWKDG